MNIINELIIPSVIFLVLDGLFLYSSSSFFSKQVVQVQHFAMRPKILGIVLCYIFLLFGLHYFIIKPHKTPIEAFLYGIVIYGVYETTNYSLLKKWNLSTVAVDTLWGGILFYLTTFLTYTFANK